MFWLSGLTGMFAGILFFLNYEKNYLTRDNIEENVPVGNRIQEDGKRVLKKSPAKAMINI